MNCDHPTIAIRKSGINPATNHCYKPHTFIPFSSDEKFVDQYFRFKKYERQIAVSRLVNQSDFFSDGESHIERVFGPDQEVLILPCGRCLLCIQARRRAWACRCINEAQMSNGGEFLTLTCSDASQPFTFPGGSLRHEPWQKFMKRLRKRLCKFMAPCAVDSLGRPCFDYPLRFFMCGEYGEKSHRPHYHALLFGWKFLDRQWVGRSSSGSDLWTSPSIEELRFDEKGKEIFGPVSNFSDISPYDISYTVGYVDKKLGRLDPTFYVRSGLKPEYVCMSRRPGIGFNWLQKYHGDVWKFYSDECCSDFVDEFGTGLKLLDEGVRATRDFKYQVPRFYFEKSKITGLISQQECDTILAQRRGRVSELSSDPGLMLESLKRAHDRCAIKEHNLKVIKAPRQF